MEHHEELHWQGTLQDPHAGEWLSSCFMEKGRKPGSRKKHNCAKLHSATYSLISILAQTGAWLIYLVLNQILYAQKGFFFLLSTCFFCFQVNFNEPLSMLQRLTEDLEYHDLLDRAAKCENSLEQLCYVAAFTVSSYSTTVFRTSKPFNPLLGETFELDRLEENGYRSICEQVKKQSVLLSSSLIPGQFCHFQCCIVREW